MLPAMPAPEMRIFWCEWDWGCDWIVLRRIVILLILDYEDIKSCEKGVM
jgi:hypothetical protein